MKKLSYLIVLALILGLVLSGCSLLSNVGQVPTNEQSGISYLTKGLFTDLVGLWSFDEEEGSTANDSSGNHNDGALYNFFGTYWVDDQWGGQALSFDGVNNYVDCGDSSSLDFTTNVTIEAWVYPKSDASLQMIVDNRNVLASGVQLFYRATTKRIEIQINNARAADGDVPYNWLDNWHHVLATYTLGVGGSVYIDGIDVSQNVINRGDIGGTGRTTVIGGRFTKATLFFDGIIDEVRIYDYALSSDTIKNHAEGIYGFNGLLAPYVAPPKAFKAGRSIPLKWQYTDNFGDEVESSAADPSVKVMFKGTTGEFAEETIVVEDPGESGYRYHSDKKTWQFNWQTKGCASGRYEIWITSMQTGQINGPILIDLQ